jgi:beta-galactosidase
VNLWLFLLTATLSLVADRPATGPRVVKTIDRDWTFQYLPSPVPDTDPIRPDYDDSHWPAIALPHTWSTYETTGEPHPFIRSANERAGTYWWHGWGWYRKRFALDQRYAGKLIELQFDGVQKYSTVYINGKQAGAHRGGYTSFAVDITDLVRFDTQNVLVVQVSNRRDDPFGGIPPMTAGNFDVYGGIYRDVRLVIRDRLSIPYQGSADYEGGTFVTTPDVTADRGPIQVKTWVRNSYAEAKPCALITTVLDANGTVVAHARTQASLAPGSTREFTQQLGPLAHPHLWSPDSPYLYQVISEVRDGERLADSYTSPLGFRWFQWNTAERRLYLNGQPLVLHGMNRHQEYPWLGDAMPKWMQRRDLDDMRRGLGMNFQRTVHYPNDPIVYDEADALGILTIEELPNIKDIAFGRDIQRANVKEAIRRDRNHPSIIIWSMGNETNQPADSAWAHDEDTTRLIYLRRGENGGQFVQLTDQDLPIENLLRCTVRGWYTNDDHAFTPGTIDPSSGQVTGSELWQHDRDAHAESLSANNIVVWIYADHGADRKYVNSPLLYINPKGFVDAYRIPKFAYYLWQANFTSKPMAYILPAYWRERYLGQRRPIVVDSNLDEVVLTVNGKTIGTAQPSAANNHTVTFDNVEVERGTIAVEARSGARHVEYSLTMAGKPARVVLATSATSIPADRSGIAVISADIVDAQGVHVYGANPPLTWTVTGPAAWLGPMTYTSDTAKNGATEGTMYIDAPVSNLLRSTTTPGEIRVSVSAPGLESAQLVLQARAPADDALPGISEPPLSDAGRAGVTRPSSETAAPTSNASSASRRLPIAEIDKDYAFDGRSRDEVYAQLERFVRERNPALDTNTSAWHAFADRLTTLIIERGGQLIADDYNFLAREYGKAPADNTGDADRQKIRATLFVPDPLPALATETYGQFEPAPHVIAERVSYATAYGLRVPAIIYRPADRPRPPDKLPGIVVVNGHGGDKFTWYAYYAGILYAQAGAVVVTYDPIGEGERNLDRKDGTRQHDRHIAEPDMAQRLSGLMITDVMQAVSYLASRSDVDGQRLAAVGYSMGSFVLGITCAVDTRLNACVLAGGGNLDGPGGYWDSSSKEMCQAIPYKSLLFLGDRGARLYSLHADRGATLIINGSADDVVAMPDTGAPFFDDLRKRTIARHGSDRNVFDVAFTPGGGHRPYFLTRPAVSWLAQRLHFPYWTAGAIANMPTTHISEWAARNHVAIDRLYATELREGGTDALGAAIPAVPHDLLEALPRDRWERDKDKYVYETWVTNARAARGVR